jgi:predicted XRE-type DNA-binding protein
VTESTDSSIIKVKQALMAGVVMAIHAQFDNLFQAAKYLGVSHDRLYKMHDENHELYSLSWLVDLTERLGATVSVTIKLEHPRRRCGIEEPIKQVVSWKKNSKRSTASLHLW